MSEIGTGDRVRLVRMPDDPDPVPVGTCGVVRGVYEVRAGHGTFLAYDIDWDVDRTLAVVVPPDELEVV